MEKSEEVERKEVIGEVAGWIDTEVIAEGIVGQLADNGIEVTAENAREVWNDFLMCELNNGLQTRVQVLMVRQGGE